MVLCTVWIEIYNLSDTSCGVSPSASAAAICSCLTVRADVRLGLHITFSYLQSPEPLRGQCTCSMLIFPSIKSIFWVSSSPQLHRMKRFTILNFWYLEFLLDLE